MAAQPPEDPYAFFDESAWFQALFHLGHESSTQPAPPWTALCSADLHVIWHRIDWLVYHGARVMIAMAEDQRDWESIKQSICLRVEVAFMSWFPLYSNNLNQIDTRIIKAVNSSDTCSGLLFVFRRVLDALASTSGHIPNRSVIELMHELVLSQFSYWKAKEDRLWVRWHCHVAGLDHERSELDIEDDDYDSVGSW